MNVGHWDTLNYYGDVPLIFIEDFNTTAVRNRAMESFLANITLHNIKQTSIPTATGTVKIHFCPERSNFGRFGHKHVKEILYLNFWIGKKYFWS